MRRLACLISLATLCAVSASAAPLPPAAFDMEIDRMAVDQEVAVSGVQLACTGIGDTRNDPKWAAYPIRVEFSNANNEYMTDAVIALVDAKGQAVLVVRCDSPWLLIKPPPGSYAVYSRLMGSTAQPRSARFAVPVRGQKRVVLQFPDA
ncbi:MAG: hypothetical protein ACXU82_04325 [Caulobacteraceae bacterium]